MCLVPDNICNHNCLWYHIFEELNSDIIISHLHKYFPLPKILSLTWFAWTFNWPKAEGGSTVTSDKGFDKDTDTVSEAILGTDMQTDTTTASQTGCGSGSETSFDLSQSFSGGMDVSMVPQPSSLNQQWFNLAEALQSQTQMPLPSLLQVPYFPSQSPWWSDDDVLRIATKVKLLLRDEINDIVEQKITPLRKEFDTLKKSLS